MPDGSGGGMPMPGAPGQVINFPENPGFLNFEVFDGIDTKPPRPAIEDTKAFWCDGFMPFGKSFARTLYDVGTSIYTAPSGRTIIAPWFYNLGTATYAAVLLSDGSLYQVATTSGIVTTIFSSGGIQNPNPNQTWMTQWNAKYLVIVSNQANGYWLWDGTNLYGAGGISPEIDITNAGVNYSSSPTVNFQTTNGSAVAPTFSATVMNGSVTGVTVLTPGSGFLVSDFVNVWFTGGGSDDTAYITPSINPTAGQVTNIVVTGSVTNLPASAYITLDGGGGTGATAAIVASNGALESITVTNGGQDYTSNPTVTLHATGYTGTFSAVAEVSFGEISGGTVNTAGSGYSSPPTITVLGDGTGAQATAVVNNSGQVTQIVMNNVGFGYTKALFVLSGGNNAADATITLMPFGIQGTTCEVFDNRVWVGNVRNGYFTAPSSPSNFSTGDGAGAFQSNDSFQRVSYSRFLQTNGFLYLVSDSSVNYAGGVQTTANSSTGAVTTVFSNLNVDPQIGSPWPASHQLFSRNIVLANSFGVFVSYGGAVTKISAALDGVYNTVIGTSGTVGNIYPSSAMASLFGIACYMLLLPIIDPITNSQVNKLFIWDGKKWFTSNQSKNLTYISSQEINSILTAWGTDGSSLFPLFQQPSTNFTKTLQSKLWTKPSYWYNKTAPEIAGLFNFFSASGTVTISIDNEQGSSGEVEVFAQAEGGLVWVNNSGQTISWINNSSQPIDWGAPGLAIIGPQTAGQTGVLLGLTLQTNALDMAVLSLSLLTQDYQSRF